jgi:eukaryotic-like serine/threonine-protein kinase
MSSGEHENLLRLVGAITDEVAVDWAAERLEHPELADRLPALRLLERIAAVHQVPAAADPDEPWRHGTWGHLEIREQLGQGSYGTVYRAYDPRLQRDVALKLLREDLPVDGRHAARILAEARLMARVRHPSVLVIHGADEHDGRVGFWTDLLDGVTLEQRLETGERLNAAEATVCGRELCRALGAVHGAGLVHGDVKAANVMRDREGRLVLMDFGAGSERALQLVGQGPLRGTPFALAPELFTGAPPSPATDLYALGVLLFRLVSGTYPVVAGSLGELREMHADGRRTRLLDLRPDLPVDFAQAVERALAPEPSRRFASAGEMEAALAATLDPPPQARRTPRRSTRLLLLAIGVLALGGAAALALRPGHGGAPAAAAPLTASATFVRSDGDRDEPLADGALVHPGDALALNVSLAAPAHVYVLNEDSAGEVFVLFPLAGSDLRNPLPAVRPVRLPGASQGAALSWRVTGGRGPERLLVVAAREPLAWLERECAAFATPVRERPARAAPVAAGAPEPERGLGAVAEAPARDAPAVSKLDALVERLTGPAATPSGVWLQSLMLYNPGR